MRNAIHLVPRQQVPWRLRIATFGGGLGLGLAVSTALLIASGVPIGSILDEFVVFVFFTRKGLGQALTSATPLILVGLAAAAALRLKFWNVGLDGQVWLGATAASGIAIADVGPMQLRIPLMLLAGAAAGAAWLAVPAAGKVRFGINEIISTLLLSYVAFLLVQHLLYGAWRDPGTGFPVSVLFDDPGERLARLGLGSLHSGIFVSLGATLLLWILLEVSRFGFHVNAVGASAAVALATGIPVTATLFCAALLSGGVAGLAGAVLVAGQEYRLTQFVAGSYTFSGIVIAVIARCRIGPVLAAALIVGAVYSAGDALKVFYQLPTAIVTLIEAVVLLSVLIAEFFGRFHLRLGTAERTA